MLLRLILSLMGLLVIGYSIYGIIKGKLHMRGVWAHKSEKARLFWIMVIIYWVLGGMLLYFSIWGKLAGK